jgi:hypothetical protein
LRQRRTVTAGPATRLLAFVPDLMDRSRVAAAAGAGAEFVSSVAGLRRRLDEAGTAVETVVVDLARPGVLDAVVAIRPATGARIIGFGAHVERDLLAEARRAGCDEVLARSAFFARLDDLLA